MNQGQVPGFVFVSPFFTTLIFMMSLPFAGAGLRPRKKKTGAIRPDGYLAIGGGSSMNHGQVPGLVLVSPFFTTLIFITSLPFSQERACVPIETPLLNRP
jgi:hypothetical protein